MRNLCFLLALLGFFACSEPPTTSSSPTSQPNKIPTDNANSALKNDQAVPRSANQVTQPLKQQQKCTVEGEVLDDNELWLKDQGKLICILADSSTYNPTYGMSHRILEVFNTYTCNMDLKLTLPVNQSPDFPYFLADINYNNDSKIVAIKAAKTIYCLDLATQKMLPLLQPKFKTKRIVADASSGNILRLELWEDFLVGFAQDMGVFVFNLKGKNGTEPILPFAEYPLGDTRFNSMFFLPSESDKIQAILPTYDVNEDVFAINPIFDQPIAMSTDVQKSALDNQYLVLRESGKLNALLIDMKAMKNKPLPTNLIGQPTKEILAWAKKN